MAYIYYIDEKKKGDIVDAGDLNDLCGNVNTVYDTMDAEHDPTDGTHSLTNIADLRACRAAAGITYSAGYNIEWNSYISSVSEIAVGQCDVTIGGTFASTDDWFVIVTPRSTTATPTADDYTATAVVQDTDTVRVYLKENGVAKNIDFDIMIFGNFA